MGPLLISCVILGLGMALAGPVDKSESLKAVSAGANTFSTNFFKAIANSKPGNLICSPISVNMVLSMVKFGAEGKTLQQLKDGLHLPNDDSVTESGYSALIAKLNDVKDVDLKLANKVFPAKKLPVNPDYLTKVKNVFNSEVEQVDFQKSADAAGIINNWCKNKTNDRIKDIVKPDDLGEDTLMVLANAIYFKGQWAEQFNPNATMNRPFHVNKATVKQVPTMYKKARYNNGIVPGQRAKFIELPYKGNEFSLVIILPDEIDGLESLKKNLSEVDMTKMLNSGYQNEVELSLPKFKIESEIDLIPVLKEMGMSDMFEPSANFSKMSKAPVVVSKAIQKAFIEVNEEGSEAAAVTGLEVSDRIGIDNIEFFVNRPAHFILRQAENKIFVGTLTDPHEISR